MSRYFLIAPTALHTMTHNLDHVDLRLLAALRDTLRPTHSAIARLVNIARGTVYSRLERLEADGIITGYQPKLDPRQAGFDVVAFATLEISQGTHDATTAALASIPEVLEIHTITGVGDLLCRIVAHSNDHLHQILQTVTSIPTVSRSSSQLALATPHRRELVDLLLAEQS